MTSIRSASRLLLTAAALQAASAVAATVTAPFGINFTKNVANPTAGTYDGVLFSDWTGYTASTNGTVSTHASTTFALSQSATANQLTGWYATQDFWNPTGGATNSNIYGSTLGGNKNTTGLAGYSALVQFSNVSAWLADNGFTSLKVTVYYSAYTTLASSAGDSATTLQNSTANIFAGSITSGNAATFTSTQTLLGNSTGSIVADGANAYSMIGSTITGITGDFLVAEQFDSVNGSNLQGGIAAIKIEGVAAVPEPSTYGLIGAGALTGVAFVRRRRKA